MKYTTVPAAAAAVNKELHRQEKSHPPTYLHDTLRKTTFLYII